MSPAVVARNEGIPEQSSPHFSSLVCLPCEYALKLPKSAMLMSFRGQSADLA